MAKFLPDRGALSWRIRIPFRAAGAVTVRRDGPLHSTPELAVTVGGVNIGRLRFHEVNHEQGWDFEPLLDIAASLYPRSDFDVRPLLRVLGYSCEPNSTGRDPLNPESVEESATTLLEHWGEDVRGLVCDLLRTCRAEADRNDHIRRGYQADAKRREKEIETDKKHLMADLARRIRNEARRGGSAAPANQQLTYEGGLRRAARIIANRASVA